MSSPRMEEDGILREWAPLSRLLQQIPLRIRVGLFLEDVKFTCVDADSECIAVGTSTGTVFWYDRRTHVVQQLKPENSKYSLTCVKVVTSVEYMVAVGDSSGVVTIFRLPKQLPDWVQPKKPEQIERYTVDDLHKSAVTALAWSINGQKLFSGDSFGSVVYTEIDYCMSLSRTCEILNEKYKIYQLNYNQHEQALIVATELRCIICHYNKPSWRIVQIGQRERHNLMDLGGCFYTDEDGKLGVYSCRGGLRLWKADLEGNVKNTIMFKNVINPDKESVRLIRPPIKHASSVAKKSLEFGRFNYWKDGLFVSYREECLLVLDPSRISVVCYLAYLNVPLTEAALTQGEMFVIMGDRELIRLAYAPDTYDSSIGGFGNMASGEPVSSLPKFDLNPVVGAVLIPHIIPPSRIKLSASTANTELSANEVMYGTDSTSLLPPVKALRDGVPELRLDTSRNHQFSAIGQQEFDEIIYAKSKYRKHKKKRRNSADESIKVNVETCRNSWSSFQSTFTQESSSSNDCEQKNDFNLPKEIQPDMRALDAIVKDLKEKERLLDAALVFPIPKDDSEQLRSELPLGEEYPQLNNLEDISTDSKVEVDVDKDVEDSAITIEKKQNIEVEKVEIHHNGYLESTSPNDKDEEKVEEETSFQIKSNSESKLPVRNFISESLDGNKLNLSSRVLCTTELPQASSNCQELVPSFDVISQESSSGLTVKDPTFCGGLLVGIADSSKCCLAGSELHIQQSDKKSHLPVENDIGLAVDDSNSYSFQLKNLYEGWFEMTCPEKAVFLSNQSGVICNDVLFMSSPGFISYALCKNKWVKLPYKARCICISPQQEESEAVSAVRLHCSIAYFSNNWKKKDGWKIIGRNVDWISVADGRMWFVSNGDLFSLKSENDTVEKVSCASQLSKVYANKTGLLAITDDNKLLSYDSNDWKRIRIPRSGAKYLAIGEKNLLWLVDQNNCLYVTHFLGSSQLTWWQVFFGENCMDDIASICASKEGVYISSSMRSSIYYNFTSVVGHRWEVCNVDVECVQICAEGVFEDKGCIWILGKANKLYSVSPSLKSIQTVPTPCTIICLASSAQALWVLSDEGEIFVRQGITDKNISGKSWRKLNLEQFERKVQLSHLSCGCDVVWGCDLRGQVVMVIGSPYDIATYTFPPAWVFADGKPVQNNTFNKVYVGPNSHMVWAVDSAGNVYAREAIYPNYLLGTGWVHVPGISAFQLSISTESVIALCREGVFKRIGVTESNFVGDAWLLMPVKLDYISATVNEGLWGISSRNGKLMVHSEKCFSLLDEVFVEKDWTLL